MPGQIGSSVRTQETGTTTRDIAVSVVVPVNNAGDYLDRCAPSLLRQSIGTDAYEVIYVDDGSTDGLPSGWTD